MLASVRHGSANRRSTPIAAAVPTLLCLIGLTHLPASEASAQSGGCQFQVVQLRSGQVNGVPGLPGQLDSTVRFESSASANCDNQSLDIGAGLPFIAAQLGPQATVITPVGSWTPNLPFDPLARWINWSAGPVPSTLGFPAHSTLYAHPFSISGTPGPGSVITLTWAVDDILGDPAGDPAPIGAYINGVPIPALSGGNFSTATTVSTAIPAGALVPGNNVLYLYQRDTACVVSGLIYSATMEICVFPSDGPCVEPPPDMRGWWPFDETGGNVASDLTVYNNDGLHQPFPGGPTPVAGKVDNALRFDGVNDAVVVPPTSVLDVSCGAFSVDLWVNRFPPGPGAGLQTLVSHYLSNGGWIFGLDASTGELRMVLEGSFLRCVLTSTATVPVGQWTHVAVTVSSCCGLGQRQVTFYINGVAAGTFPSSCCNLTSLGGPASLAMGGAVWISDWFNGILDEVEYFCRVLKPAEVAALHAAGSAGKCKSSCHASWDRQVCVNFGFSTPIDATVVNNSTVGRMFSWSITPSGNCPLSGVTYTPSSGTVFVPPGGSATINSTATVPGPLSIGQACFDVTFTNLSNGTTCSTMGSIISEICGCWINPGLGVIEIGLDESTTGTFRFVAGPDGASFPFEIVALPSDMVSTDTPLSLNGLPPGEPVFGVINLPPNGQAEIALNLQFNTCGALFSWTDVILKAPAFDGTFAQLSSFGVRMVAAQSCEGDLNDDGVVNGADLGILLADWGTSGPGDLNHDGVVNGADLGIMLSLWGPCP